MRRSPEPPQPPVPSQGDCSGGIAVAIRDALEVPVKLVGVGERVEDVQPFDPDTFIDAMFESGG